MTPDIVRLVLEYGIAGLALYMMYMITYNHLIAIEKLLIEIRDKI